MGSLSCHGAAATVVPLTGPIISVRPKAAVLGSTGIISEDLIKALSCTICTNLLYDARQTPCGHIFCKYCILRTLQGTPRCPICRGHVTVELLAPNAPINGVLDCMPVKCAYWEDGCHWRGRYDGLRAHFARCPVRRTAVIDAILPAMNFRLALPLLVAGGADAMARADAGSKWRSCVTHGSIAWLSYLDGIGKDPRGAHIDPSQFATALATFFYPGADLAAVCHELGIDEEPYWHQLTGKQLHMLADLVTASYHGQPPVPMDKMTFLRAFQHLLPSSGIDNEQSPVGATVELLHTALLGPLSPPCLRGKFIPLMNRAESAAFVAAEAGSSTGAAWILRLSEPRSQASGAVRTSLELVLTTFVPISLTDSPSAVAGAGAGAGGVSTHTVLTGVNGAGAVVLLRDLVVVATEMAALSAAARAPASAAAQ